MDTTVHMKLAEITKYILSVCDNVSNISSRVCAQDLYAFLIICCFDRQNNPKYVQYAIPYDTPEDFDVKLHKMLIFKKLSAMY